MQIDAASQPSPEAPAAQPTPELDTETVQDSPVPDTGNADYSTDDAQSEGTHEGQPDPTPSLEERWKDMEASYTRKTQAVAEIRKAAEARVAKLDSVVTQGEALVAALAEEFQSEFGGVDWGKLAAEDPAEYVRQQHKLSTRQQKLQAAVYRLNQAKGLQQEANAESVQERLREEQAKLVERIPEWKDPAKYAAEAGEISKFLSSAGYDPYEVAGITDHRAVDIARKAMLYDKLRAKTPKSTPVTKAPAPVPKAPTRAQGQKDPSQMTDREFAEWRKRQIAQRR